MTASLESEFADLEADGWTSESKEVKDDSGHSVTQITFTRGLERKRLTIGMSLFSIKAFWESFDNGRWITSDE